MKLARKMSIIVGFIVFLNCFCCGCGSKKADVTKETDSSQNTVDRSVEQSVEIEQYSPVISTIGPEEAPVLHKYTLCAVNDGKVVSSRQCEKQVDPQAAMDEVYENMLMELGSYLGYELKFHEVVVKEDGILIDWDSSCDLFQKEKYAKNKDGVVRYIDYDTMVFGILDSVNMTIKENLGETVKVCYTENGKELILPDLSIVTAFLVQEEYQGSSYYRNLFLARAEGSLSLLATLGMSYNDVLIELNKNGIASSQKEEFSMLGDHTGWDKIRSMDEYLKQAWIRILLQTEEYEYIFDGKEQLLKEIKVCSRKIPSSRGLLIGDHLNQMVKLYGEDYTMYAADDSLLYEYCLEDCYFRVEVDEAKKSVIRFGIASYSYNDIVNGQQILEKIKYQEEFEEVINQEETIGI